MVIVHLQVKPHVTAFLTCQPSLFYIKPLHSLCHHRRSLSRRRRPFPIHAPTARVDTPSPSPRTSSTTLRTSTLRTVPPSLLSNTLWDYAWPRALLLVVAAVWGTNFATVKLVQTGAHAVPLGTAALARFSLAALVLLPLALREHRFDIKLPNLGLSTPFLRDSVAIGLALCVGYGAQSVSLLGTEANKSAFICSLAVVIVPLLERAAHALGVEKRAIRQGEGSVWVEWGAPGLAVLGVAMLELGGASAPCSGDAWALLQAVGFAMGFIGNARALARYPGYTLSITAVQLATVAAGSALWALTEAGVSSGWGAMPDVRAAFGTWETGTAVVYAGVVTTAGTVWLENVALSRVSASEMALLLSTEPFWAAAFSGVLLGEHMGVQAVGGGAVILAACVLNQWEKLGMGKKMKEWKGWAPWGKKQRGAMGMVQSMLGRRCLTTSFTMKTGGEDALHALNCIGAEQRAPQRSTKERLSRWDDRVE